LVQDCFDVLVKWRGLSYLHLEWVESEVVMKLGSRACALFREFVTSPEGQLMASEYAARVLRSEEDPPMTAFVDESLTG
jgi:hypothetical protein